MAGRAGGELWKRRNLQLSGFQAGNVRGRRHHGDKQFKSCCPVVELLQSGATEGRGLVRTLHAGQQLSADRFPGGDSLRATAQVARAVGDSQKERSIFPAAVARQSRIEHAGGGSPRGPSAVLPDYVTL